MIFFLLRTDRKPKKLVSTENVGRCEREREQRDEPMMIEDVVTEQESPDVRTRSLNNQASEVSENDVKLREKKQRGGLSDEFDEVREGKKDSHQVPPRSLALRTTRSDLHQREA